jgi:hypothetical protein
VAYFNSCNLDRTLNGNLISKVMELTLLVVASPELENVHSKQVMAACVTSLAVLGNTTAFWPESCERLTGLVWNDLPLTEVRDALEEVELLVWVYQDEVPGHLLPTARELEEACLREQSRREE